MADGKVTIETLLESKEFERALSQLGSKAKAGMGLATKAIIGTGTAITGIAGLATKAGIEYESAFAGVKKTVNASDKELKNLSDGIRDMAKTMPQGASEIAHVAEAAGQLGIKTKSILGFSKTMTQLGDATNLTAEQAADSLARFANITGMSQDNFDRLGSTIVELGNNLATTEAEIVEMSMRIAGAGHQVGMSEAEIMSFSGALSSVGINAEAGGTAFSKLIGNMNLAVGKGGAKLTQFAKVAGMTADEFKKKFKTDASGAVLDFVEGLGKIKKNGGNVIKTLSDMGISDVRMRDALLRASGASKVFAKSLKLGTNAWKENSALTTEVKNRYSTLESRLKMLKNTATDFGIEMYQSTKGPLNATVDEANKALKNISKAYKKNGTSGAAKAAGEAMASMAVRLTKGLPKLAELGGQTIKAFASGLYKNRAQLAKAAASTVKALASAIAGLLPRELGNSLKNLTSIGIAVAKPLLKIADVALKVASSMSGLTPVVLGTVAAFKAYSVISPVVKTLMLMHSGQMFVAQSARTMAIAQALSTTVTKAKGVVATYTAARETALAAAETRNAIATAGGTTATIANTVAVQAQGVAAGIAAVATKGLSAAMAFLGGPVGLAVAAIGALAGVALIFSGNSSKAATQADSESQSISRLKKEVDELTDSYNQNAKSRRGQYRDAETSAAVIEKYGRELEALAGKHNKSKSEILKEKAAVEKLNEVIPGLNLKYDEQKDSLNMTISALRQKIELAKQEAKVTALKQLITDAYKDEAKNERELARAKQEKLDAEKAFKESGGLKYNRKGEIKQEWKNLKDAEKVYKKVSNNVKKAQEEVDYYNKALEKALDNPDATLEHAKKLGIKIPKHIAEGIKAGGSKAKAATASLNRLIAFKTLSDKAKKAGIKIPKSLANGMKSGKQKIPNSVNGLKDLIKWDSAVNKAKKAGIKIPKKLANGVRSGKMSASRAAKELNNTIKFKEAEERGRRSGAKTGANLSKGLSNKSGAAKQAGRTVANAAYSGTNSKTGSFFTIGSNMGSGLVNGLKGWLSIAFSAGADLARKAVQGAKSKKGADTHSPSRKTIAIGRYIGQGLVYGMRQESKAVRRAAAKLIGQALKMAKNPKGQFSKIGSRFADGLSKSVASKQRQLTKSFSNVIDKAIKKAGKSQESKKAARNISKEFAEALRNEGRKINKLASDTIVKLANTYQKKFDELKERRTSLKEQLREYGNMLAKEAGNFEASFGAINSGGLFSTMRKRLKKSAQFDKLYKEMKSKLPADLMSDILGLGDTEALKTLKKLSNATSDNLNDYLKKYKEFKGNLNSIKGQTASGGGDVLDTLTGNTDAKKKFQKLLDQFKAFGASPELREAILKMGIDDGTSFLENFFGMSESRRKEYLKKWQEDYKNASSYSNKFYKDQFKNLDKNFLEEFRKMSKKFSKELKKLGMKLMESMIAGLKARQKKASSSAKKIIKEASKSISKEIKHQKKKSKTKIKTDVKSSKKSFGNRFAKEFNANSENLLKMYGKAKHSVDKTTTQKTLKTNATNAKLEAFGSERNITEIHVHANLEGREVAHEIVRFVDRELNDLNRKKERDL